MLLVLKMLDSLVLLTVSLCFFFGANGDAVTQCCLPRQVQTAKARALDQATMEEGMISINKWEQASKAYFLTHLHPDCTVGLSRRWKRGPLFCSPLTSHLLPAAFPGFDPSLIRVLQLGTAFPLRLPSDDKGGEEVAVHVTAIDANHCPGTVAFYELFFPKV